MKLQDQVTNLCGTDLKLDEQLIHDGANQMHLVLKDKKDEAINLPFG